MPTESKRAGIIAFGGSGSPGCFQPCRPAPSVATCAYAELCNSTVANVAACDSSFSSSQTVLFTNVGSISGMVYGAGSGALTVLTPGTYEASYTVVAEPASGNVASFRLVQTPAATGISATVPCSAAFSSVGLEGYATVVGGGKFGAAVGDTIRLASNLTFAQSLATIATTVGPAPAIGNTAAVGGTGLVEHFGLPVTQGSLLYVGAQTGVGGTVTSVTDSLGRTYVAAGSISNGAVGGASIWYTDTPAPSSSSIDVTVTGTPLISVAAEWMEVQDAAIPSLLTPVSTGSTGSNASACDTVRTAERNALALLSVVAANTQTISSSASATVVQTPRSVTISGAALSATLTNSSPYPMCATLSSSGPWAALAVAIAPVSTPPPICDTPANALLNVKLLCPVPAPSPCRTSCWDPR